MNWRIPCIRYYLNLKTVDGRPWALVHSPTVGPAREVPPMVRGKVSLKPSRINSSYWEPSCFDKGMIVLPRFSHFFAC